MGYQVNRSCLQGVHSILAGHAPCGGSLKHRAKKSPTPELLSMTAALSQHLTPHLVSIISTAFFSPTARGRRCVPPNPGMMPSCSSGRPKEVPASVGCRHCMSLGRQWAG